MPSATASIPTGCRTAVGALVWLDLSVSPFRYDPVESAVHAGLLVVAGAFEFGLDVDDAFAA